MEGNTSLWLSVFPRSALSCAVRMGDGVTASQGPSANAKSDPAYSHQGAVWNV